MARCKATIKWNAGKVPVVVSCDLDENHLGIYPRHYDKTIGPSGIEWLPGAVPAAVQSTRTSGRPQRRNAALKSASAHTGIFEVVND